MRTLKIPYIEGLESMDLSELDHTMAAKAALGSIDTVNWPDFPYRPNVIFTVARSRTHICVFYNVIGSDLRALALEDNGPVWEDSCCEFFVADPNDGTYYNFELNCIGTLLAAKRTGRHDPSPFSPEALGRVIRHATVPRAKYDISGPVPSWNVAMCIPFDLIGVDCEALPESLRANFYKCGDKTAHPHFLSWNPIDAPSPDFHRPEFFGLLEL